jgi:DNA-binding CsgD family transcriptional regulator
MAQGEVQRFLQSFSQLTSEQRFSIGRVVPTDRNTVVIFSSCGETVCTFFTSRNFAAVLGYPARTFIDEGVQFVISRVHPTDLPSVLRFMEASHRPAATWFEDAETGSFQCTYRFKHADGRWRWVTQQLLVLSLTGAGLLDKVLMTFYDCTTRQNKLAEQHTAALAVKRTNSKLLDAVLTAQQKLENQDAGMAAAAHLLTAREKEVLQLVAKGFSSKQIAHELSISKHTVESHRKNLLQKLNANNVADLIQKAHSLY